MENQMNKQEALQANNIPRPSNEKTDTTSFPEAVPEKEDELKDSTKFVIEQLKNRLTDLLKEKAGSSESVVGSHAAKRIRGPNPQQNPRDQKALMVNIHGSWGSGKTYFLEQLGKELSNKGSSESVVGSHAAKRIRGPNPQQNPKDRNKEWIVLNFNAWQHQRLGSPWWWLITVVSQQGTRELLDRKKPLRAVLLKVRQRMWYLRFTRTRWLPFILISLVLFVFFGLMITAFGQLNLATTSIVKAELQSFATGAQSLTAIITAASAFVAFAIGLSRALVPGPVNTATDAIRDPMRSISKHFDRLISIITRGSISKHSDRLISLVRRRSTEFQIAIFIEDLDRCQSTYVVELLEGIQTLLLESPVCYVVAAEQRWMCASFEKVYGTFATNLEEPGRPLGYMFVEKAFQVTASVPSLPKKLYLQRVLQDPLHKKSLESLKSPEGKENFADILRTTLEEFLPQDFLVDTSPRMLIKIVDECIFRKQSLQKTGHSLKDRQLVLWTLIDLQWPLIAEYLKGHPEKVGGDINNINWEEAKTAINSEHTFALLQEDRVQNVVKSLKKETVDICTSLYPLGFMRER